MNQTCFCLQHLCIIYKTCAAIATYHVPAKWHSFKGTLQLWWPLGPAAAPELGDPNYRVGFAAKPSHWKPATALVTLSIWAAPNGKQFNAWLLKERNLQTARNPLDKLENMQVDSGCAVSKARGASCHPKGDIKPQVDRRHLNTVTKQQEQSSPAAEDCWEKREASGFTVWTMGILTSWGTHGWMRCDFIMTVIYSGNW